MADKVQMKAKAFGTRSGARGIIHTDDRKGADLMARYPLVSESDAVMLEREGLAERYDGKVPSAHEDDEAAAGSMTVDERAGVMVEDQVDAENSVDLTTGLSTRQTTAFPDTPEDMAAAGAREIVADDGRGTPADDTAPASGVRGSDAPKASSTPAPASSDTTAAAEAGAVAGAAAAAPARATRAPRS